MMETREEETADGEEVDFSILAYTIIEGNERELLARNRKKLEYLFSNHTSLRIQIISIFGDKCTGKSFLMNLLINFLKNKCTQLSGEIDRYGGFKVGIWNWNKKFGGLVRIYPNIFEMKDVKGEKYGILLMEIQGLFGSNIRPEMNWMLFYFCRVISNVMICNIKNEKIPLSSLNDIYANASSNSAHTALIFLLRDVSENEKFAQDVSIALMEGYDPERLEKLNTMFKSTSCYMVPKPGNAVLKKKFTGKIENLSQSFVKQLNLIFKNIVELKNPQSHEYFLTASQLSSFFTNMTTKSFVNWTKFEKLHFNIWNEVRLNADKARCLDSDRTTKVPVETTTCSQSSNTSEQCLVSEISSGHPHSFSNINTESSKTASVLSVDSLKNNVSEKNAPSSSNVNTESSTLSVDSLKSNVFEKNASSSSNVNTESSKTESTSSVDSKKNISERNVSSNINNTSPNISPYPVQNNKFQKCSGPLKSELFLNTNTKLATALSTSPVNFTKDNELPDLNPPSNINIKSPLLNLSPYPANTFDTMLMNSTAYGSKILIPEVITPNTTNVSASTFSSHPEHNRNIEASRDASMKYYTNLKQSILARITDFMLPQFNKSYTLFDDILSKLKRSCHTMVETFFLRSKDFNFTDIYDKIKEELMREIALTTVEDAIKFATHDYMKKMRDVIKPPYNVDDIKTSHECFSEVLVLTFISFWTEDTEIRRPLADVLEEKFFEIISECCKKKLEYTMAHTTDFIDLFDLDTVTLHQYFPPHTWSNRNNKVNKHYLLPEMQKKLNFKAMEMLKQHYEDAFMREFENSLTPWLQDSIDKLHIKIKNELVQKMHKLNPSLVDELIRELNRLKRKYEQINEKKLNSLTKVGMGAAAVGAAALAGAYLYGGKTNENSEDMDTGSDVGRKYEQINEKKLNSLTKVGMGAAAVGAAALAGAYLYGGEKNKNSEDMDTGSDVGSVVAAGASFMSLLSALKSPNTHS